MVKHFFKMHPHFHLLALYKVEAGVPEPNEDYNVMCICGQSPHNVTTLSENHLSNSCQVLCG